MNSTLKTVLGFVRSVFRRINPLASPSSTLQQVYNFRHIDGVFTTSGQPDEQQFRLIRDAGYEVVVNLAPSSIMENSVRNEADLLAELGLKYVHIPVDFKHPTDEDFSRFVNAVGKCDERKLWVHCAANMRVSAFAYRYRVSVLQHAPAVARTDLDAIWEPTGAWRKFLGWQRSER